MKNIYKSEFSRHDYEAETETIFTQWFSATEHMDEADFKNEMQEWLNAFRKCKPKYLYDNCCEFNFPITPILQVWMARLLNKEWIALGLKKYAHIMPSDLLSELSVEQLFGEFFAMDLKDQFPIENFSSKEEALAWLYFK